MIADINRDERPGAVRGGRHRPAARAAALHRAQRGAGRATTPHRFDRAVIATGSDPAVTAGIGLEGVPYLTNETVFSLTELPDRLSCSAAGPSGSSWRRPSGASAAASPCSTAAISCCPRRTPRSGRWSPRCWPARASTCACARLADRRRPARRRDRRAGRRGRTERRSRPPTRCWWPRAGPRVAGIGLDALGVEHGPGGVAVDERMRTSAAPRLRRRRRHRPVPVHARRGLRGAHRRPERRRQESRRPTTGSCPGSPSSTPRWRASASPSRRRASEHGGVEVVRFPMSRVRPRPDARRADRVRQARHRRPPRGGAAGRRAEVVGAHIVGPHAGELLHEVVVAMQSRDVRRAASPRRSTPTPRRASAVQQAASQLFPIGRALVEGDSLPDQATTRG